MRYNKESCAIEISLEELCLLALRRGDLDSPPLKIEPIDDEGIYYRLQSEAGAYYNPNMELSCTSSRGGIYYTVSTLADGVIRRAEGSVVDKLKSVGAKGYLAPPDDLTLAMLKCSAYFLCIKEDLPYVKGRVSYVCAGKKLKYFYYDFARVELMGFYNSLLDRVERRARLAILRETEELESAANATFPYGELREGQEMMIREAYSAIKRGKRLFVEAPTGTGKTISALFPAVRALGKGECDKIFYLTPKTATRREAFLAAAKLHSAGALTRTVMISAKEQTCPCRNSGISNRNACSSVYCEYSRGYYDRVEGALCEMLENYRGYSRSLIEQVAKKHRVCPYELSLDLSELCDVIICDYNYVFDPSVYFRRYFGNDRKAEKYVFLVDEAHNLADRARDMYSAQLSLSEFESIGAVLAADSSAGELEKLTAPVISAIRSVKKLCRDELVRDENGEEMGFYMSSSPIEKIIDALTAFKKKGDLWLYKNENSPIYELLAPLCASVRRFLCVCEYFDSNFRFYAQISGGDIAVRIYCLDPSDILDSLFCRASASVLFSATLTPIDYFRDVLGGAKNAITLSLPSPFCSEDLCVAVADYVNTRLDTREDNAKRFATVIAATVTSRAGNYIAYFPSYQCLEQTYAAFVKKYPKVETVCQKKYMSAKERDEFLAAFKDDVGHLRVGFCVLGGVFSEGVDLPGSRLIGSIIFGVGLPGLSNERNIMREYFDMRGEEGMGYDYAYTFPGMNDVLQAAGRVIRTANDCGVVVLADDRYATPKYRALFPKHWQGVQYAGNASSLAEIIRRFWENRS
ncbi:MAG: ATP-dependent DNA helicase [Ruminococcaceae bacterium]|nr:ATP-dependent DNA helicase [Oscillospiraceae bacterium]